MNRSKTLNNLVDASTVAGQGVLYVISAPSGAGKTSLVKALVKSTVGFATSISYTTRAKREGEHEGVDYHFKSAAEFVSMLEHSAFLEHASVFGNYYGTSKSQIESYLSQGLDVILEIDWQGAVQVRKQVSSCVSIFVLPPSRQCLQERLEHRGQDDANIIAGRMSQAVDEMSHYAEFDYLVVNDEFDVALLQLQAIVNSQRLILPRQAQQLRYLIEELLS